MGSELSYLKLSALEIRELIVSGRVSAVDVVRGLLDWVEKGDREVRCFVTVDAEGAMAQAEAVDRKVKAGERTGLLAGIPVAVKDNICTESLLTSCSSHILEGFEPPYDAHVVTRLQDEDAVVVGKTNMDEFAMGSSTENSGLFPTGNPWDTGRVPGGSSGGSAAAVAAEMAYLALGSDTGGSIRQPAALCGVVGFKPTYGRVSRYGLIAFASSLDQIGPIGRTVSDVALMTRVISGHDPRDSTCVDRAVPDYPALVDAGVEGRTFGMPVEYFGEGLEPETEEAVRAAVGKLKGLGGNVVEISLPHTEYAVAAYYLIATAEASSNLARYDGVHYGHRPEKAEDIIELFSRAREEGFGSEVKRRVMLGTYALSAGYYDAYYLKASKVRSLIKSDFDKAFGEVDFIVCPTSPSPAFKLGEKVDDPLKLYLCDIYTIPANLAGLPGISIPCGLSTEGLPIGVQLMGRPFDEEGVLQAARAVEGALDFEPRRPPLARRRTGS